MRDLMTTEFMAVSITVYKPKIGQERTLISRKEGSDTCTRKREDDGYVWLGSLSSLSEIFRCSNSRTRSGHSGVVATAKR